MPRREGGAIGMPIDRPKWLWLAAAIIVFFQWLAMEVQRLSWRSRFHEIHLCSPASLALGCWLAWHPIGMCGPTHAVVVSGPVRLSWYEWVCLTGRWTLVFALSPAWLGGLVLAPSARWQQPVKCQVVPGRSTVGCARHSDRDRTSDQGFEKWKQVAALQHQDSRPTPDWTSTACNVCNTEPVSILGNRPVYTYRFCTYSLCPAWSLHSPSISKEYSSASATVSPLLSDPSHIFFWRLSLSPTLPRPSHFLALPRLCSPAARRGIPSGRHDTHTTVLSGIQAALEPSRARSQRPGRPC